MQGEYFAKGRQRCREAGGRRLAFFLPAMPLTGFMPSYYHGRWFETRSRLELQLEQLYGNAV
jgi:hypothetical protein